MNHRTAWWKRSRIVRPRSVRRVPRRRCARSPNCTRPRIAVRWANWRRARLPVGVLGGGAAADGDFGGGEIVVVGRGAPAQAEGTEGGADGHDGALDRVLSVLLAELPLKQAARLAAKIAQVRDNEAYKRALQ